MSCHIRVCTVWKMLENEAWSGKVLDFILCLENTLKAWTSTFENQYFALNFFQWNMKSMFFFIASTWYVRTLYMQNDGYLPQARCGNTPWPRQYGRNFTDYLPTSFLWMKALFFYGYFIVNLFQGILLIIGHYFFWFHNKLWASTHTHTSVLLLLLMSNSSTRTHAHHKYSYSYS